jgi:hypothetical protein
MLPKAYPEISAASFSGQPSKAERENRHAAYPGAAILKCAGN